MRQIALDYKFVIDSYDVYVWEQRGDHLAFKQPDGSWLLQAYGEMTRPDLQPTFSLDRHLAQLLMEALSNVSRPSERTGL